eukprot:364229-Chlamydomonas_euryale.AAC.2
MEEQTDGWMDGWMDGRVDEQTDVLMDEWMDAAGRAETSVHDLPFAILNVTGTSVHCWPQPLTGLHCWPQPLAGLHCPPQPLTGTHVSWAPTHVPWSPTCGMPCIATGSCTQTNEMEGTWQVHSENTRGIIA